MICHSHVFEPEAVPDHFAFFVEEDELAPRALTCNHARTLLYHFGSKVVDIPSVRVLERSNNVPDDLTVFVDGVDGIIGRWIESEAGSEFSAKALKSLID
jgi:hypothetical protein